MTYEEYMKCKEVIDEFDKIEKLKDDLYKIITKVADSNKTDITWYDSDGKYTYLNKSYLSQECCDNLKFIILEELNNEMNRLNERQNELKTV